MSRMVARVLGLWLALIAALALPAAASAAPGASVGGLRNPASGALELTVNAVSNVELVEAAVQLDGRTVDTQAFPDGSCEAGSGVACPATVTLDVVTLDVPDGAHTLKITVSDVSGEDFVREQAITVNNTPPPNTPTVTVNVGSGTLNPQPSPPDPGPVDPDAAPICRSPRLAMFLDSDPLRYRRGVPVLKAGKKYRFEGALTCVENGKRRPAKRGTLVQVRNVLRGFTIFKPAIEVGRNGRLAVRLRFASSRTLVFRVRGAGGDIVRVRIPLRVVRAR